MRCINQKWENIMSNFKQALRDLEEYFEHDSMLVHTNNWQGTEIKDNSQAQMCEVLHESFRAYMGHRDLAKYAEQIQPNLPWADNHFLERVGGQPLNPGVEWANWPWCNSNNIFIKPVSKHSLFTVRFSQRLPRCINLFSSTMRCLC